MTLKLQRLRVRPRVPCFLPPLFLSKNLLFAWRESAASRILNEQTFESFQAVEELKVLLKAQEKNCDADDDAGDADEHHGVVNGGQRFAVIAADDERP